ncbi:non-ribosomal peptide synthetase [Amycolatopsis sp. H20-H5]|uniref:non-ribosomal peptide synthetase n=1 Tax=Amycolatopsis sp. H20-H5 TaxID=3046309 RepID=UPI002DB5661E|nr:amino acid adenylation domain-containing protein [Amycolatopsis sp. H20-H5]MEC3980974.1 amino acid adenylation domain-containing protein [Amycolatopsis sp. H20-H5]
MSTSTQDATTSDLPPARGTFVRDRGRDAPAAGSHALCVRFGAAPDADALAARLAGLAAGLPAATGTASLFPGEARLWTEQVPCRSGDQAADRWRRREMARPVVAHRDGAVRAAFLRYTDGVTELVVVAHRAVLGARALRAFVAEVAGAEPSPGEPAVAWPAPETAQHVAELGGCELDPQLDWGLGRPFGRDEAGTCRVPLAEHHPTDHPTGDVEGWVTALGVVLARYESLTRPAVAAVVPDPVTGCDGIALVGVDAHQETTLGAARDRVRAGFAAGPAWHTAELDRELSAAGGGRFDLGLVVDGPGPEIPGASVVEYEPFLRAPFPITISVGGGFLRCDFRRRLVSGVMAEQLLRHVRRVHTMLVAAPETPLSAVTLVDETELAGLIRLGRPARPLPVRPRRGNTVITVIAEVAAARPDAVAVCFDGQRLTYAELERHADRLAHGLRALGVADGDRVGVCLERSAELVVALLGVLKAGAAYVPMDPAYPRDRLAYTTTDAGLTTVITSLAEFPGGDAVRVVGSAELAALAPADRTGPPASRVGPDDPAYVIYTSGSTGKPKGVVVPHVNVLNLMAATTGDFGLGPDDAWTVFHSSAFDFSVWEIWGCLLTGGRLVVVPYWVSRSPEQFHRLLVDERVTVLSQTPSAFAHLVEVERDGAEPAPVRLVIFGGEGLDPRMLLPWFDRHPETRCRVVNMYGITETTVHVTAQTVTRAEALSGSRSVGTALPGWWLRVADPEGRPQPVGVAGEIYVGGAGLALHYLNKPELTAQRFLTDPHTGERMYRSGDKGRFLPDGRLEHLGRLDSQVKLRGFRIELDEIRSVLLDDPLVSAAAVVLNQEDPADSATAQLDAFVVLEGDDTGSVRARAARFLPEYMVPATITVLPRLPLTTNGKLDVRKLPKPVAAGKAAEPRVPEQHLRHGQAVAPADDFGAALIEAWQDVLGVSVGPDDNFFDLGGNSLFAMRVGAALRRGGGGFSLQMRDLYLRPTIRQLTASRG